MKRVVLTLLSLILAAGLNGCTAKGDGSASSSSTDPTPPPVPSVPVVPPTVTETKPLSLHIYTQYDQFDYITAQTIQETGTTECAVTDTSPVVTCTIIVPEGRLYLSKLHFAYSWMQKKCNLMEFQPYYYRASNTGYLPPGFTGVPIDCTGVGSALCYGGSAVDMVDDFPRHLGLIYEPDENNPDTISQATKTAKSAYSHNYGSNRWTVNDIPLAKLGTAAVCNAGVCTPAASAVDLNGGPNTPTAPPGDTYLGKVAGSLDPNYRDYKFTCRDHWYDPVTYSMTIYVKDEDSKTGNPVENDFFTWKEWP